jgi:hypothetical protein
VIRAYEEQMAAIEALGGRIILMASRALARVARSPDDYERVYDRILSQVREPVIIHWLGDMFDPALAGYWGSADPTPRWTPRWASSTAHAAKVDGIKISLLDKDKEIAMRRRLPAPGGLDGHGVRMYTGDDFNYAELIAGDGRATAKATRCWASSTPSRRRPAPRWRRWPRATARVPRHPGAHGAAVAPHLQGAHALLQDRRGLHGLAERPPGPLRDGRRPAEHALAAAPGRAVPPGRCRRA